MIIHYFDEYLALIDQIEIFLLIKFLCKAIIFKKILKIYDFEVVEVCRRYSSSSRV